MKKRYSGIISSQARLGQAEKKKKKIFRSGPFLPELGYNIPKTKSKKIKKHHLGLISLRNLSGQIEKEKTKIILIRSYLTRARAFPKK